MAIVPIRCCTCRRPKVQLLLKPIKTHRKLTSPHVYPVKSLYQILNITGSVEPIPVFILADKDVILAEKDRGPVFMWTSGIRMNHTKVLVRA